MQKLIPLITGLIVLSFLFTGSVCAGADANSALLKKIRQRIENTQVDLAKKQRSEVKLSRELVLLKQVLKRVDKRIAFLTKEQRRLVSKVKQQQGKVKNSQSAVRKVGRQLDKRLVALYKEGEVGPLKILFSADTPTELVQQYQYLTRVLKHDKELLHDYRIALADQKLQLTALEDLQQQQQKVLQQEQQQRKTATAGKKLQTRLLSQVKKDKKQLKKELQQLEERAARLQTLIKNLKRKPEPSLQPGAVSFLAGKGKLNWPIAGEVLIGFGTQKDSSLGTFYESNGIEISAAVGSSILAVADGRVVFADWFKGYGNLMILSHPGGYHTLYAQVERLEKSIGEEVRAGTLLGVSGLAGRESIYFEIRHNGSPVNPLAWLQRR